MRQILKAQWRGSLIVFFAGLTLCTWVFASPIGSSPDDGFHLSSIWCSSGGMNGVCEPAAKQNQRAVAPALIDSPSCFAFKSDINASCQNDNHILDNFDLVDSYVGNFAGGGYPPIYYATMHLLASTNIEMSALTMRMLNVFIFLTLAVILWRYSSPRIINAQRYMWLLTLIPLGLFIVASNNPSSWAIMGVGFSFLFLFSLFDSVDIRSKVVLSLGYILSAIVGLGSRADAAIYIIFGSVVTLVVCYSKDNKQYWIYSLISVVAIMASIAFFTSGQSQVVSQGFGETPTPESPLSILGINIVKLPELFVGIFGGWGLGWLDTPMPAIVSFTGTAMFIAVVSIAIQKISVRYVAGLIAVTSFSVLVPLYILQKSNAHVGESLQPRYLLPLYILLIGVCLVGVGEKQFLSNISKLVLLVSVSISQSVALYINLDRYVNGLGIPSSFNLDHSPQWWWENALLSPMQTFVLGTLAFIATAYLLIEPKILYSRLPEMQFTS